MFNESELNVSSVPYQILEKDQLSIHIYQSEVDLAQDTAYLARNYLNSVIESDGQANIILATGYSQILFLEALTAIDDLNWSKITLFHLDEYLGIEANHPASFRYYLRERVEEKVKPRQFHYIQGDTILPLDECDRYTQLLKTHPIALCCLGIGDNGHLAFNDPSVANFEDPHSIKLVKLETENREQQVNRGDFLKLEDVPQYAFTLTIPMITAARKIFCLAPQKQKAQIIKTMLTEPIDPSRPASILRTLPNCSLFLDRESASLLD
ncbi:MAG: glucosamine-6-phosphate deaminase [Microcystaceae cyanobacterium]